MQGCNQHIVIIGAGFSGIGMAIRLKLAGIDDFTILEQADDVGGTWRDNHYPGAACDVPSPVYCYSFEANPGWSKMFSPQKEIFNYLKHCVKKYNIHSHIRFQSQVEAADFDEKSGIWTLAIKGQKSMLARFFILGSGGLSRPSYPDIPGFGDFQGELFHSARWNHEFELQGARVGVIGTGASSIQIVPSIVDQVAKLSVFQRTPAWILPKPERDFSAREKLILTHFPLYQWLLRKFLYWQFELRAIGLLKPFLMKFVQKSALKYIYKQVKDPSLCKKLTPNYTMGCKRILLSNDFYPALNHSHVELVSEKIEKVTKQGILTADGREHQFDALVCATGFQVAEASAPFPITGLDGRALSQVWKDGAEAYLATSVTGFPNFFIIVGPNSGLGHNSIVFIIESQVQYILGAIQKAQAMHLKSMDVKAEVQEAFNRKLQQRFRNTVWTTGNCVSWYHNKAGKNTTIWPGFSFQFRNRTRSFQVADYTLKSLPIGDEGLSERRRENDPSGILENCS